MQNSTPAATCPVTGAAVPSVTKVTTPTGDDAWLVTGYQQVRELFTEPRLGRSHRTPETAPRLGQAAFSGGPIGNFDTELADHARMRSLLQPHFSPKRMRELRPRVEQITTALLDAMEEQGSPADLQAALSLPLPLLVICELLGVPYEEREEFREWVEQVGHVRDRAKVEQGYAGLYAYCLKLVQAKRRTPGDDVVSRLCAVADVSDDEIAMHAMVLLFAGHETSAVQIGAGVLMLLENPDQWRTLHENPALVVTATEELLRACNASSMPRYARDDLEIGGARVAAGELVLLGIASANHDAAVFTDPDTIDIARQEAAHFLFGYGARYCIGAPLARIELQVAFGQLVSRFPTMTLAVDPAALSERAEIFTGGLTKLPVRW
ncbi:cytochrome P450 [Nocardia crassostreae]|uniref:cytochrome P450 n=1 Tax=Nocardia crassostreae TaxID=53428 RepID=UPI000836A8BB|nr:cytochrome P450 [Nocardia crassostreae]